MLGFSLLPWQQIENRLPVEDSFCLFTLPARVRLQSWLARFVAFQQMLCFPYWKIWILRLKKVIRVDEQFLDQFIFLIWTRFGLTTDINAIFDLTSGANGRWQKVLNTSFVQVT